MNNKGRLGRLCLSKSERLSSAKHIELLFQKGISIKRFPLVFNYVLYPSGSVPVQALFAAPKRNFKKAVDRNRIKRVLRDRYRLLKPEFFELIGEQYMHCALIYVSKTLPDYKAIDKSLQNIIKDLKTICASVEP